jgi:hypothetical protein
VLIRTIRKFSIYSCTHIVRMQFISVLFLRSAARRIAAHATFLGTAAPPLPAPAMVVPPSPPPAAEPMSPTSQAGNALVVFGELTMPG